MDRRIALAAIALSLSVGVGAGPAAPGRAASPPALSFVRIAAGPEGGTVWQGLIPNHFVRGAHRPTVVYLPPGFSESTSYPVVYLLQGFRGSPYQYSSGLDLPAVADVLIARGQVGPFVAVAPPAGLTSRFDGEWAGAWEEYLVRDVVPWVDRSLPVAATPSGRVLAGLSAGGYGAVDIGLRHPRLFGTLEAWSGYFRPIRDGALRRASRAELAAHDPSRLARREAPLLRRLGTRFFLSSGTTHDRVTAAGTRRFARELATLRLPYRLVLEPGGHDGRFWRRQLPAALEYAEPPTGSSPDVTR